MNEGMNELVEDLNAAVDGSLLLSKAYESAEMLFTEPVSNQVLD